MKNYKEILHNYHDDLLKSLGELIAIRSVEGEKEGDMPFGRGVHEAYSYMLNMAEKDGFETKNVDNYGGHIEFKGKTDDIVAIVGHVDVVPEGDLSNWKSDPYKMDIRDEKVYGRGAVDDKGPFLASYYAMKALRDSGFVPEKTIRIIIGCDEETEEYGMAYYMEREKDPVTGFSPDADFPVLYAEKGLITFYFKMKLNGISDKENSLVSLHGGEASNAVADWCEAVISSDKPEEAEAELEKYVTATGYSVEAKRDGKLVKIRTKGKAAHGSTPEAGFNAISGMFDVLGKIKFADSKINEAINFYNKCVGFDVNGENLGCCFEDEPSGKLTVNIGVVEGDENEIKICTDIRFPVTYTPEMIYESIEAVADKYEIEIEEDDYLKPLYVEKESPLVKNLMKSYQENTGDYETEAIATGGATYARSVPNTLGFGPLMPGQPDVCHQANEFIRLKDLFLSADIYADAIYSLSK